MIVQEGTPADHLREQGLLSGILTHAPFKRPIVNKVIMEAPSRNESDANHLLPINLSHHQANYGFKGNPVNNTQKLHLGLSLLEKKSHDPDAELKQK